MTDQVQDQVEETKEEKKARRKAEREARREQRKAEKAARVNFAESDAAKALGILNEDGNLTAMPPMASDEDDSEGGYNPRFHLAPSKSDFAEEFVYLRWQAEITQTKGANLLAKATRLAKKADEIEKYGNAATRAKIGRREKLLAQLAALDSSLEDEGVDVQDLDD